jgi:hypothetical protein
MWDYMAAAGPGLPPEAGRLLLDATGRAIWRFVHKGGWCSTSHWEVNLAACASRMTVLI